MAFTVQEFLDLDIEAFNALFPKFPCTTCQTPIKTKDWYCEDCYYNNLADLLEIPGALLGRGTVAGLSVSG